MTDPESGRRGSAGEPGDAESVDLEERKERVLHTRVPDSLDRHIKRRARNLGMSVSTVVRNVLLNTFGLVEDIVTDSAKIAFSITGEEAIPSGTRTLSRGSSAGNDAPAASEIVGWQEAVLNLNAVCDRCNTVLHKGTRAAIGVRERAGPRAIICTKCLGRLAAEAGTAAHVPRGGDERGERAEGRLGTK
jgi:hypothetical protein